MNTDCLMGAVLVLVLLPIK